MPIYQDGINRPYIVIGKIDTYAGPMAVEGMEHAAVRVAKAHGADGILRLASQREFAGTYTTGQAWGNSYTAGGVGANVSPAHTPPGGVNVAATGWSNTVQSSNQSVISRPQYSYSGLWLAFRWLE